MSTETLNNADNLVDTLLDRVKEFIGSNKDADVARALKVSRSNIPSWRERGVVPHGKLVEFALANDVNLEWLFRGTPPMSCDEAAELADEYDEVAEGAAKYNRSQSPLNDLKLLETVIRGVERNRPHMRPDNKAKLITLLCEWARLKYEEAEEADEEFELDDSNVIRIADVIGGK